MKKILLLSSVFTFCTIAFLSTLNTTNASSSLPNVGNAGAPMDNAGQTCTSCHGGTATQTTGVISSDIPASGYISGTTYNFTVTMSGAASYGYEITPQTPTSNVGLGTLISAPGSSVSTKYVRQSIEKTGASATWTFKWTAPATAPTVTFYGAFNYANNNNNSSGDVIKTSSVTYLANTTGIADAAKQTSVMIFPNPTTEQLHISNNELLSEGKILDVNGNITKIVSEQELITKSVSVSELATGVYFLHISSENGKNHFSKFIKN
ncbi:MAG: choice-of-anchor V domain-containing protein [Bacteroidota bacterium]